MKFIDLQKQYKKIKKEVDAKIIDCLEKGNFILGQPVFDLEKKLANYVGVRECITCASGTDALVIPLMANGIGSGDIVFTTNFSYFATAEAIKLVGATPIFVDICPKTFNINPNVLDLEIQKTLKNSKLKPKAIISVDLFGQLADYSEIQKIAKEYNLILIEDAAQSFGASYNGSKSCSFGDVAATSFYPAKPLGCYGDGGAIFTNDLNLAEKCRSIRVHGQGLDKYNNIRIGMNSRLDTIQAIVLIEKMKIFDKELKIRNDIATHYSNNLKDFVKVPFIVDNHLSAWAQYSILTHNLNERTKIIKCLTKKNIPTSIFYREIFSDSNLFENINQSGFPSSKNISERILSIPFHPYLTKKEQNYIIESIVSCLN